MRRSSRRCSTGACACARTLSPKSVRACLDDLVFLPANLSRLVIDPYREACKISWSLGERIDLDIPFFVAGFDEANEELRVAVDRGAAAAGAAYLGATRPGPNAPWLQLCEPGRDAPSDDAAGVVYRVGERWHPMPTARARDGQILGLLLGSRGGLEDAIVYALEHDFDLLVLDGTGALGGAGAPGGEWPELRAAPDLALVHDTIATLRRLKKEEMIDIAWFGGARSGTDAAKLVGLGVNAIGYGVAVALALGGEITPTGMRFAPDRNEEERADAVVNILKANAGEASDDGALRGQDAAAQHRAGGPALGDPGHCRRHRHPARGDAGGVVGTLHHPAAADAPTAVNLRTQPAATHTTVFDVERALSRGIQHMGEETHGVRGGLDEHGWGTMWWWCLKFRANTPWYRARWARGAWHRARSNGRRRCRESFSAPAGGRARSRRGETVPRESRPAGGGFASALNACSERSISPPSTHKGGRSRAVDPGASCEARSQTLSPGSTPTPRRGAERRPGP